MLSVPAEYLMWRKLMLVFFVTRSFHRLVVPPATPGAWTRIRRWFWTAVSILETLSAGLLYVGYQRAAMLLIMVWGLSVRVESTQRVLASPRKNDGLSPLDVLPAIIVVGVLIIDFDAFSSDAFWKWVRLVVCSAVGSALAEELITAEPDKDHTEDSRTKTTKKEN